MNNEVQLKVPMKPWVDPFTATFDILCFGPLLLVETIIYQSSSWAIVYFTALVWSLITDWRREYRHE